MEAKDTRQLHAGDARSIESWLVSAGRDRRPGAPLNVPPWPASNFVLGGHRAYARDDGTPGWEALEEIVGGLQGASALANAGQRRGRWRVRRIAVADTAGWIQACGESDLVWLESPSNPMLAVAELGAICA